LYGKYWMCHQHDIYGFKHWLHGAMAEYMKFPAHALNHRLPPDMDPRLAVLVEPLACSIHAVQRAEIELGDVVVAGPAPAPLLRAENFYRYQVMMRTPQMSALSRKLSAKREALQIPDDIRLIIDIDPMTLS